MKLGVLFPECILLHVAKFADLKSDVISRCCVMPGWWNW